MQCRAKRDFSLLLSGSKSSEHSKEFGSERPDPTVCSPVSDSPGLLFPKGLTTLSQAVSLTANAASLGYARCRANYSHGNWPCKHSVAKCD